MSGLSKPDAAQIETWIDALIEGEISPADHVRLEAELIVDADIRRMYYRRIRLNDALRTAALDEPPPPIDPAKASSTVWKGATAALAIAASLLLIGRMGWLDRISQMDRLGQMDRPNRMGRVGWSADDETLGSMTASGYAVLRGQSDADWSDDAIRVGDLLPVDRLELRRGLACVELLSGVRMVVAGGSQFTIDSPMHVTMHRGSLHAHVPPPAIGFEVETPGGKVVDFGTEFIVDASATGDAVRVVEGEVDWHPRGGETARLTTGGSTGTVASLMGPSDFERYETQRQSEHRQDYWRWSEELDRDPATLAHYRFDADSRLIDNRSSGAASAAVAVATGPSADRWGYPGAVDLSPTGSRVRINVPPSGDAAAGTGFTMFCWVKIDSLDRQFNSLMLTDGHELGEPHWQLTGEGKLFFSVKHPGDGDRMTYCYKSAPIWSIRRAGRWMMLAVTYDWASGRCRHFVDGQIVSDHAIPPNRSVTKIAIGSASIGNWSRPAYSSDPQFVIRNLNGSIDEFVIRGDAMTPEQIRRWYDLGNPY